jgi:arylsulfatase A-like enzyme
MFVVMNIGNYQVLKPGNLVLIAVLFAMPSTQPIAQPARPNIIHILADDLGWGSVGFNNPSTYIQTPNIDAVANGGMKLTRSYASTVCSPTRASLMTGFHNGRTFNDRNANIGAGLRPQDVTVGNVLSDAGYRTAVIGKWGWGADNAASPVINNQGTLPTNQGFQLRRHQRSNCQRRSDFGNLVDAD